MGKCKATIGEMQAKIDKKRKDLYELARIKGIASSEVLRCSEELDQLIFILQHMKYVRCEKECSK
ncbi:Spo0E family sporulation regulatory protein-aspartic acid phosphatase [Sediminibacillus dalangtanensis]|uniref:Spo0E family sporulation regulatory protein-aspartic acid phosphatase n=1 Tax=Sediminibacillus dalangtanensis TaxID=2729421 RepID=A0ABX7VXD2_9BACI|nr:aspartyl-phosphate phosphatase Spo0E family protein [Sediminibacillus dalangtanensis]QTM98967.1 Spo0E family sporulation regulatory protein-aspartic acid phosphatase [Sediminibacillus dalangtanensis]